MKSYYGVFLFIFCLFTAKVNGQAYNLKKGQINLSVTSPECNLKAENQSLMARLHMGTGNFTINVPIAAFEFKGQKKKNSLSTNCLLSSKFPMINFKGKIEDLNELINDEPMGSYARQIEGNWTIEGENFKTSEKVQIEVENKRLSISFVTSGFLKEMNLEIDCQITFEEISPME